MGLRPGLGRPVASQQFAPRLEGWERVVPVYIDAVRTDVEYDSGYLVVQTELDRDAVTWAQRARLLWGHRRGLSGGAPRASGESIVHTIVADLWRICGRPITYCYNTGDSAFE